MTTKTFILLIAVSAFSNLSSRGEDTPPVQKGFEAEHYETLWTKSPFAVATPDAAPTSSDYTLVGVAKIDGVYYASVIKKQTQEHFVVTSDTPNQGLKLISVNKGATAAETVATLDNGGSPLSLKLDTTSVAVPLPPGQATQTQGNVLNQPTQNTSIEHPFVPMIHRPMRYFPLPPQPAK